MAKHERNREFSRREDSKDEKQIAHPSQFIVFSFKDFREDQPKSSPQTVQKNCSSQFLTHVFDKFKDLSHKTMAEAIRSEQVKIYGDFPPKTDFRIPQGLEHIKTWAVIRHIGGQAGTIGGYTHANVFFVVFLDPDHRFWITEKKHT